MSGQKLRLCTQTAPDSCVMPQARDPIPQFKKWVLEEKILSEQQISDIEKDVEAVVEDAVQFAEESPKPVRLLLINSKKYHSDKT